MHGSNGNITPFPRANAFIVYNAVSNRLVAPYGPESPRPEFIAARKHVSVLQRPEVTLLEAASCQRGRRPSSTDPTDDDSETTPPQDSRSRRSRTAMQGTIRPRATMLLLIFIPLVGRGLLSTRLSLPWD